MIWLIVIPIAAVVLWLERVRQRRAYYDGLYRVEVLRRWHAQQPHIKPLVLPQVRGPVGHRTGTER